MQKLLPALALAFVIIATPAVVFAKNNDGDLVCAANAEWSNHGAYVSCVAHTHPGGDVVSAAAQSDIGKKNASASPSTSPAVSPSPSASPVVSPSPSVSPSPDVSPSPTLAENESGATGIGHAIDALQNLIDKLGDVITRLENLL